MAAAAVAPIVALATVWHPIPGIRSSAAAIFVVEVTVVAAAPTVVTAVAVAATAAASAPPLAARSAAHANGNKFQGDGGNRTDTIDR